jgi:hypothetical protein
VARWLVLFFAVLGVVAHAAGDTLTARDTPNDHGGSITVGWSASSGPAEVVTYALLRSESARGPYDTLAVLPATTLEYEDSSPPLTNGASYYYKLVARGRDWQLDYPDVGPAIPKPQWFHTGKTVVLVFALVFSTLVVLMVQQAKFGRRLYVRPIAGINAVDEAIGRATEMGKPILFVPGIGEAYEVATIAAFTVLGRVAKRTAEYGSRLLVPNTYATVMIIAQEVVKAACLDAGRPDAYNEKDVFYVTSEQFPFTAAVNGLMLRERTATNFYLGKFYAESLILAETGFQAGSIQIAGTDELTQIPFFVAACDYTLMGEELYAASAYLSNDPLQLGTLKAQDIAKGIIGGILVAGILAFTFGTDIVIRLLDIVQ